MSDDAGMRALPTSPGGVRVDHAVSSGTFSLDGGTWDVDNNVWVIGDDDECIVVDAPHDARPILALVGGRRVVAVLCTHAHDDHINAAVEVAERGDAPIWLHPADLELWAMTFPDRQPSRDLLDELRVEVAGTALTVIHTPGHSPGSVYLADTEAGLLFSGDTWHPELAKAWFLFNGHIFNATISARIREMATVRIAWLRRGEYEWAQRVRMAKGIGMSDAEVDAISEGPDSPVWGSFDSALLRAVDQLSENRYIDDELWAGLSTQLDRQQLMDFVFTVGAYDLLCMATNNFGLGLDPGLEGFPAEAKSD